MPNTIVTPKIDVHVKSEDALKSNKFSFLAWVSSLRILRGTEIGLFVVSDLKGDPTSSRALRVDVVSTGGSYADYYLRFSNSESRPILRSSGVDLTRSTWHLVGVVCGGDGNMSYYVDGMTIPPRVGSSIDNIPYSVAWSKEVRLGGGDVWVPYLSRVGDHIKLYKVRYGNGFSLTQDQVKDIYNREYEEIQKKLEEAGKLEEEVEEIL